MEAYGKLTVSLLELVGRLEVGKGLPEALHGALLRGTKPHTGVIELLVGFFGALGVADLALKVVMVLGLKLADAVPCSPLDVSVDVHLDDTVLEGELNLVLLGARPTVEHKVDGLVLLALELFFDVSLRVAEDLGAEDDIARLVNAVDVAEGGCDGELRVLDGGKGLVHLPDLVGLRVHGGVVDVLVVDAILLPTGDAKLHFQEAVDLGHALHVLDTCLNVLLEGLLREVKHVRGEEGLAVLLVVLLVGGEHAVEPGEELLGTVVGVEDDGHTVGLGHVADIVGAGDGAEDAGLETLLAVGERLASHELGATVGELDHDGGLVLGGSLQNLVHGGGGDAVDSGDGIAVLLGSGEELLERLAGDDTGLDRVGELGERLPATAHAEDGVAHGHGGVDGRGREEGQEGNPQHG
mmetsp:Transcript_6736/g.16336  ORF Transcript_6736/g.16336 Transcript_6736/m.16336 type:complete len:410 (+) Transcript_6736:222-1451(+)